MSSSERRQSLQRVNSYQWPTGHVGHLSEGQQGALQKFKDLSAEKGYYTPAKGTTPASHDDETMLRYLRARKFIPQDAFGQFKDTEDWRQKNQIEKLYDTIDIQEYDQTRRLYPQWTGRRDNRGIPLYVFEVAHLDKKEVSAYANDKDRKKSKNANDAPPVKAEVPRKMLRLFALYENLCRFVLPLCSAIPTRPNAETPVSQSSNIVDISKVGLKQFWDLRGHLQDSSALATAHYPETLDRIFIVGAPSFFPTVWDWAKSWFDPITVAKISILSKSNTLSTLSKFVHPDNIPKKYGGNLEWSFGDMPYLEPDIVEAMRWKKDVKEHGHRTLPLGPIKWQYDEDGDLMAVETGTENGKQRNNVVAGLHPDKSVARLALSPGRAPHSALFATVSGAGAETVASPKNEEQPTKAPEADGAETAGAVGAGAAGLAGAAGAATVARSNHEEQTKELATTRTESQSIPPPASNGAPPEASPVQTTGMQTQLGPRIANGAPIRPASNPSTADPNLDVGKSPDAHVDQTSRAGTYTVPYRDHENDVHAPPLDSRQGTSSTRYEQQSQTHADGVLAHGTPETREDGQGVNHAVMEPRTVGQAPKETKLFEEEEPAPTMMEQAQEYASKAYESAAALPSTVMNAVGMGNGAPKEEEAAVKEGEKEKAKAEDPRVDEMDQSRMEEFLRAKTMSSPGRGNA